MIFENRKVEVYILVQIFYTIYWHTGLKVLKYYLILPTKEGSRNNKQKLLKGEKFASEKSKTFLS